MGNPIPTKSRQVVNERDNHQCQRCGVRGSDYHHRRSRSVRDGHCHCACNGILLCYVCHGWVHANPALAMENGLIVSRHCDQPGTVPVRTYAGWVTTQCDGGYAFV